tara:strand:+ start:1265 stop:1546 length:282 start_codon:yes stop_codon:yes gene_type:complete
MGKALNDPSSLEITLSVKLLVQLVFFVFTITGAWYALNGKIDTNSNDIRQIEKSLVEYDKMMEVRVSRLEEIHDAQMDNMNKSLLSKVLGGGD